MQIYQQEFIKLAIQCNALKFGTFKLKSGRISPYFFNAGCFNTGNMLAKLGQCYAETINGSAIKFDMLFGPAYKGIPLVTSTAIALANQFRKNVPYAFNRKEAKDHGEGGTIVGAELNGKVLIIDDVITAGTAIRDAIALIENAGAKPAGIVITLDRQEHGRDHMSAIQEIEENFGLQVISIIKLEQLIEYVKHQQELQENLHRMLEYQQEYGTT